MLITPPEIKQIILSKDIEQNPPLIERADLLYNIWMTEKDFDTSHETDTVNPKNGMPVKISFEQAGKFRRITIAKHNTESGEIIVYAFYFNPSSKGRINLDSGGLYVGDAKDPNSLKLIRDLTYPEIYYILKQFNIPVTLISPVVINPNKRDFFAGYRAPILTQPIKQNRI